MSQIIDLAVMLLLGALYGCGMGGGGLLVVYLTLVRHMPQSDAQALNLFFYIVASTSAAFLLLKKRKINPHLILICALSGIPGAYWGSILRKIISVTLLQKIFGAMLVLTGVSVFFLQEQGERWGILPQPPCWGYYPQTPVYGEREIIL